MQLQQLAYFVAVADARHFTRAAELTGVAQPTLSQQVRALERSLGEPLFARRPGNVELTAAGAELLPIAQRMLADAELARRTLAELRDLKRGQVRLGATPSLCTGLLPPVVAEYRRLHRGVTIIIREGGSVDLRRQLAAAQVDLALLTDAPTHEAADDGLTIVPLFVEELVVITSSAAASPTRHARIGVEELRGRPLVMFREGYDLRDRTVEACAEHGFEPTIALEAGEMDAVLSFVAAGIGAALVPLTVASADRFRVTRLRSPGLGRGVQLARRAGIELPPAAAAIEQRLLALTG